MKRPVAKLECLTCGYADYRMSARVIGELALGECPKCGGDMAVVAKELPPRLSEIDTIVGKHFDVTDFYLAEGRMEFEVSAPDTKSSFARLLHDLKPKGFMAALREREGELRLLVARSPRIKEENVLVNVLLLFATLASTFLAGYYILFDENALYAVMFSVTIMLILGAHELGHKIAAWRHDIASTMPYFIPAPTGLGTLGALIKIKSPIPTKEALVEMGASGPLFGFLVALPLTLVGLRFSRPDPEATALFITPLIFAILQLLTFGYIPSGLKLNPLAFAGLVAMVVTGFNLMPADQLDGGHVARGQLDAEKHYKLSRALSLALILIGFFNLSFLIWGLFIFILSRGYHVGALDDVSGLSRRQKFLAASTFVIFLLCFPIPL
jgi:membrane-associated protease RseP (regulator of RpoE activity)